MKKKIIAILLFFSLSSILPACSSEQNSSGFKTEATWADLGNYMFAVGIEDFNGDIFEPGTYRFYPDAVDLSDPSKTPVVWDIYMSENLYSNSEDLQDSELIATVGGLEKDEYTGELESGKYVYINYNEVLGEPTGMLQIKKQ